MANIDFYNLDKYNSYVYCVSKTHRYAGEKEITMDMLKGEPIILFNTDSVQTQTVITRLRSAGITSKFGIIWKKGVFVPDQLTKFVKFIQEYDVTPYLPKL